MQQRLALSMVVSMVASMVASKRGACSSASSSALRALATPTIGCEQRQMEAGPIGSFHESTGSRAPERNCAAFCTSASLIARGTTRKRG